MHVSVTSGAPFETELQPNAVVITTLFAVIVVILQSYYGLDIFYRQIMSKRWGDAVALGKFRIIYAFKVIVAQADFHSRLNL